MKDDRRSRTILPHFKILKHSLLACLICVLAPGFGAGADKLRIGYTSPGITNGMLWVTSEAGLFQKNDLDVEVIYFQGNLAISALIAGQIQAGQMTGALMSPARLQGSDAVMLMGFANKLNDRLVVRPNIRTTQDLKAKRVGISRFGAVSHRATLAVLTRLGLNPDKDVVILQTGDIPTRVAALIANKIDAALIEPPDYKRAVEAGMRVLVNVEEMEIPFQSIGLVTTERIVAKNPSAVRRLVKSFVDGVHFMRGHAEASKRALGKYMSLKDEGHLEEAYHILRDLVSAKPYPNLEGFKTILAGLSDRLPAARTADPKSFVDIRFLEELDRSGYIDALYRQ